MNKDDLAKRIWGESIKNAKAKGIISDKEAEFLLQRYLEEFRGKNGWDGKAYIKPRLF